MRQSGSKLVLAICGLAAVAAAVGWWSRFLATHRAAEFWGPETAALLRGPSQVEMLELTGANGCTSLAADTRDDLAPKLVGLQVIACRDISTARGLTHLRSALVEDRNFDWNHPPTGAGPAWAWALCFHTREHAATLLFPSDFSRLGYLKLGKLPIGKLPAESHAVTSISCRPLKVPLTTYFQSLETAR